MKWPEDRMHRDQIPKITRKHIQKSRKSQENVSRSNINTSKSQESGFFLSLESQESVSTQSHKRVYQKVYPPDPEPLSTPPSFCPITTCCPCIAAACTAVGATPAQTLQRLNVSELSKNKQAFGPQPGHTSLLSGNSFYTHLVVEEV